MAIKTIIHSIDENESSALISIQDGDVLVVDKKNMNIQLNDDKSANAQWLTTCAKVYVFQNRLQRLEETEDDLL